jgi:hypothetical protein
VCLYWYFIENHLIRVLKWSGTCYWRFKEFHQRVGFFLLLYYKLLWLLHYSFSRRFKSLRKFMHWLNKLFIKPGTVMHLLPANVFVAKKHEWIISWYHMRKKFIFHGYPFLKSAFPLPDSCWMGMLLQDLDQLHSGFIPWFYFRHYSYIDCRNGMCLLSLSPFSFFISSPLQWV